ncbi:hypothetical protein DEU56DRAFT_330613 [Suillus clintonianus]|uniref:uncharacterized protein n=1 Tax=Suillus clintonianus TaxID=1904413 RepID=UPI001B86B23C|nr:uncharacterized protein DEU56DRAFT_330613 [Suillus clintonianus]KAG2138990.1 hypothetical protein DEU56DRAFT_330613 [Suillus clintonianus]
MLYNMLHRAIVTVQPTKTNTWSPDQAPPGLRFQQSAMARTKQTPLRGLGRMTATRVKLEVVNVTSLKLEQVAKVAALPQVLETARSYSDVHAGLLKNDLCVLCRDGMGPADFIYECDEPGCPHVMCTRCMVIPNDCLQDITQPDVKFRCIHCHTAFDKKSDEFTPYYGFFKDGNPILSSFLPILGQLQLSKRSQISSTPILLIHFKLVGSGTPASPIDALHSYLSPYFPNGGLRMVEMVFDLGTNFKIDDYSQRCETIVNDVMEDRNYQTVSIAISNYTNDENGDPFLGYNKAKNGSYIATTVANFMDVLLDPWCKVIRRAKNTTLFYLGCGAIVAQPEGFRGLRLSVVKHKLPSAIAFTAKHFRPAFITRLLISFAQSVLIEVLSVREAFPGILDQSGLGMHTEVILMTEDCEPTAPLQCTRYSFAHANARPWGNELPIQCPQCGCSTSWNRIKSSASEKCIVFQCSFAGCGRVNGKQGGRPREKYTFTCKAPQGSKILPGLRQNAVWLEIPLEFPRLGPNAVAGFSASQ